MDVNIHKHSWLNHIQKLGNGNIHRKTEINKKHQKFVKIVNYYNHKQYILFLLVIKEIHILKACFILAYRISNMESLSLHYIYESVTKTILCITDRNAEWYNLSNGSFITC